MKFNIKSAAVSLMAIGLIFGGYSCQEEKTQNQEPVQALDLKNMNTSVKPGDDFYEYANGLWLKNNPVPDDQSSYGTFYELFDKNRQDVKSIIDSVAGISNSAKGSIAQKVGDFYRTGMDTVKIEQQGLSPLKDFFTKIEAIKTIEDVQACIAFFHSYGLNTLFDLYASNDMKNSEEIIANISQSGLGLPERDYYLSNDAVMKGIRDEYLKHVAKMFQLMGDDEKTAKANAQIIMTIETRLAKASANNIDARDPLKSYNKMTVSELQKLSPNFNWKMFFSNIGYPSIEDINIAQVNFMKEVSNSMKLTSVAEWKTVLKWKIINSSASYISDKFVKQDFEFYNRILEGQDKMKPRLKNILDVTNAVLGEAIGQLYVKKFFPPEAKQKMLEMVNNLKTTFRSRVEKLEWMDANTKQAAIEKLNKINVKIGYPDKWRDYTDLDITTDSYVMNIMNFKRFEFKFNMNKIGKPVDKSEWFMSPQTINAYYDQSLNEIVFPAGILQPPFFNLYADDAVNYGAIGMVIGHELTHGFDKNGKQYDKNGNLNNWWSDKDVVAFDNKSKVLIDQFNAYEPLDSCFINGEFTLSENIADLGGATISYYAYKLSLKGKNKPENIDGFTDDQRFFISFCQVWRSVYKDQALRQLIKTDPHTPERFRVIGTVTNMPEFYAAFPEIKEGDKFFRPVKDRPVIW